MPSHHPTFSDDELATEIWKPVVEWETLYEVSSLGRVRRVPGKHSKSNVKILQPVPHHASGYMMVLLSNRPRLKQLQIHCVVAASFIGVRPLGKQVNHLDGNKANNRLINLEYCTAKENMAHATRLGLRAIGERNGNTQYSDNLVSQIRAARLNDGLSYPQLARRFGVSTSQCFRICKNQGRQDAKD